MTNGVDDKGPTLERVSSSTTRPIDVVRRLWGRQRPNRVSISVVIRGSREKERRRHHVEQFALIVCARAGTALHLARDERQRVIVLSLKGSTASLSRVGG